jgi:hypothetical protein
VLDLRSLLSFHDGFLQGEAGAAVGRGIPISIAENHSRNAALWREEDRARRDDVPAAEIVRCKRAIDRHNQKRNDAVEAIDAWLLDRLEDVSRRPGARQSSETPGAMIDRLSILALKIHHMRLQAERADAGEGHRETCRGKLATLQKQRADLARCLQRLLGELSRGESWFAVYRQFKMYNDPALNPQLYEHPPRPRRGADAESCDVLIPTFERRAALAVTLTSLFAQTERRFRVVVSDQSESLPAYDSREVQAVVRLLRARGCEVELHRHLPRRGLAEQRHFLLEQARAPYALFLDDDVILESGVLARLLGALRAQGCGFVGAALIGLSFAADVRPHQQAVEFWDGPVRPEAIAPGGAAWARHHLHSAANLWHLQRSLALAPGETRLYKVAWIGGCVLYDVAKLRSVGGFSFWRELPSEHCGEDALAQLRVMARYGGCGVMPSGAYHQELPTTVPRREVDAPKVLSCQVER